MKVRNKMMEREYILKEEQDLPRDEATVFTLKGLTFDSSIKLQSRMTPTVSLPGKAMSGGENAWADALETSSVQMVLGQGNAELRFMILDEGLCDVHNLIDASTGQEIEFPKRSTSATVKKEWFSKWLDDAICIEIANEITSATAMKADEQKN